MKGETMERSAMLDELQRLEHDLPFMEHELTSGYGTQEEVDAAAARIVELRRALYGEGEL